MSLVARQAVVASPNTFFSAASQRADLLDFKLTDSELIALIQNLLAQGHIIEFLSIRSDHHDDGPKGHAGGLAFDSWPLASAKAGDWLDATDPRLSKYVADIGKFRELYQLGLAGTADTSANQAATGLPFDFNQDPCAFHDSGGDHVHAGVHPA